MQALDQGKKDVMTVYAGRSRNPLPVSLVQTERGGHAGPMSDAVESDILHDLCTGQNLAVLATGTGTHPYASLVAVALTPDLRHLYFATPRATRKCANLAENSQVALLMDNRTNQVSDFSHAAAATFLGTAEEVTGAERDQGLAIYLARHPHLEEFTAAPSCAFFKVRIDRIYLVTRFQSVMEYHFSP